MLFIINFNDIYLSLYACQKGGGIIDLEPCLTHSSTMEPTLAPVAVERTMTTRAAASVIALWRWFYFTMYLRTYLETYIQRHVDTFIAAMCGSLVHKLLKMLGFLHFWIFKNYLHFKSDSNVLFIVCLDTWKVWYMPHFSKVIETTHSVCLLIYSQFSLLVIRFKTAILVPWFCYVVGLGYNVY